jgi:hypothetical protein
MELHGLTPSVKHGGEAWLDPKISFISTKFEKGRGSSVEKGVERFSLV